jgi:hypothetical protein
MERKNRLKNVAPDDKAAKALLNGRLMDGDFAAWKAKTVTTVQRIEDNHFPVAMTVFQTAADPIWSHGLDHSGVRCLILKEPQDDLCF